VGPPAQTTLTTPDGVTAWRGTQVPNGTCQSLRDQGLWPRYGSIRIEASASANTSFAASALDSGAFISMKSTTLPSGTK
jgi:hypothetical protein